MRFRYTVICKIIYTLNAIAFLKNALLFGKSKFLDFVWLVNKVQVSWYVRQWNTVKNQEKKWHFFILKTSNVADGLAFSTYNKVNISPIIQKVSFLRLLPDFMSFSFLILISSTVEIHWNIVVKMSYFILLKSYQMYHTRVNCEDLKIIVYNWKKKHKLFL